MPGTRAGVRARCSRTAPVAKSRSERPSGTPSPDQPSGVDPIADGTEFGREGSRDPEQRRHAALHARPVEAVGMHGDQPQLAQQHRVVEEIGGEQRVGLR